MKKIYINGLILVILCFILSYTIINTNMVVNVVLDYSKLFLIRLFPVSFLFFIFSSLLMDYQLNQVVQKIFKINSVYFYFFFISLISGFPAGAFLIKEGLDRGIIDSDDANKIIMYVHFPNPLFILNSVFLVTKNLYYTLFILFSIIISNFIIFIFIKKKNKSHYDTISFPNDFSSSLKRSINKAFNVILIIYGTSLFFYLIAHILSFSISNSYFYVFINGLFDLTKGVYTSSIISNCFIRSIFILFFVSFGSLSIHFQVKSILSDTCVSYKKYLIGRIISSIISIIIFVLFCWCCDCFFLNF